MNTLSEKVREILALILFGLALFAFLATLTFTDSYTVNPNDASYWCGKTGHGLARFMLNTFGYACYALYFCIAVWGVILFIRKNIENLLSKVFGLLAFTLFAAAILSHFFSGHPTDIPDQGGLVGLFLDRFFTKTLGLGVIGAKITLVLLAMITFLLATDWLYYSSLQALSGWIIKKRAARKVEAKKRKRNALPVDPVDSSAEAEPEPEPDPPVGGVSDEMKSPPKKDKAFEALLQQLAVSKTPKDAEASQPLEEPPPVREKSAVKGDAVKVTPKTDGDPIHYSPPPIRKQKDYKPPPLDLLDEPESTSHEDLQKVISQTSTQLEGTLRSFKIDAEVVEIQKGPVITMFEMELAPGIKVERIRALDDDIAMAVKAQRVRIVAPIPGKSTFGVEVPNAIREVVRLKELLSSKKFDASNYALPICLGKDAAGRHLIEDLAKMPHLLVAGATGSGKSVCLNTIIMSILYTRTPEQTKMILMDPKMVELSSFKSIPHLMCPVVTDMKRASAILEWAVNLMDARYQLLSQAGVRNIYGYNKLGEKELRSRLGDFIDEDKFDPIMPFIVIIVDELADLMMVSAKEVESFITRLAQKSRAVGIHLILATQRPSTNVITGLIKANMPTRIAFQVASKIDSRVILDINGAEKLLGQGDMLYIPPRSSFLCRAQGAYVSDDEIRRIVTHLKEVTGPVFEEELLGKKADSGFNPSAMDELYDEAAAFIIETQRGSASLLQRRFSIGYTRASRLIDLMGEDGILGEHKGSQAREVLYTLEEWEERCANKNADPSKSMQKDTANPSL